MFTLGASISEPPLPLQGGEGGVRGGVARQASLVYLVCLVDLVYLVGQSNQQDERDKRNKPEDPSRIMPVVKFAGASHRQESNQQLQPSTPR
jgi:hypothetical protein